jgi:hypothetical protein
MLEGECPICPIKCGRLATSSRSSGAGDIEARKGNLASFIIKILTAERTEVLEIRRESSKPRLIANERFQR